MSRKIAYSGILLAINLILLLLINVIPVNTLFLMGLASLPIAIIIMEYGPKSGFVFYIASVILGFIVINSKFQWVLNTFTFGIYGLIKYIIERDRPVYIEYFLKILFANVAILIVYFILKPFVYIPVNLFTVLIFEVGYIVCENKIFKFSPEENKPVEIAKEDLNSVICCNCNSLIENTTPKDLEALCNITTCINCKNDLRSTGIIDKRSLIYNKDSNKFDLGETYYACGKCEKAISDQQKDYFKLK